MHALFISLNILLCLAGLVMCICRARFIAPKKTKQEIRTIYRIEAFAFFAVLFAPLYAPVNLVQLILLACNVFRLWHGRGAWLRGLPAHAAVRA
ncbi:MAG: hypothetical protein JNM76_14555 [Betaproteobacteria bacterium]|nr:hypothetical protein [Betaproteobacteria bacterium]